MQRFAQCSGSRCWLYIYLTLLSVSWGLLIISQVGNAFVPTSPKVRQNPTTKGLSDDGAYVVRRQQQRKGRHVTSTLFSLNASPAVGEDREKSSSHNRDSVKALGITIQPATFHGLRAVSRMLVEEFYGITILFAAHNLVELNRLQTNFHMYGEDSDRHLMLIATSLEDGSLAGFVDIDGRPRKKGHQDTVPPRPYLSDLAVSRRHRRKGIGTALVRACEEACLEWGYDRMFLKVHDSNLAAQKLYEKIGYDVYLARDEKDEIVLCGTLQGMGATEG